MYLVLRRLVVGVGVHCGHEAIFDAHSVVQHLGHRGQTIGGARGIRHDRMIRRQLVVVDAVDDCEIGIAGGS